MPGRKTPLVNGEIYHILNRGVASQPTFNDKWEYKRAAQTMLYYQNFDLFCKYSRFLIFSREKREEILSEFRKERKVWVKIIAYCFMPNHFHFILRQERNKGISKFLGDFTNSYTRYFNARHEREGPVFKGKFKAIRVESEEQLLHLSRYIHLNPYSSYIIKKLSELVNYSYSSLPEYLGKSQTEYCWKDLVLANFSPQKDYKRFVFSRADYQRSLEEIKHLVLEN